ncbi:putative F-box domain, leucine-rich repeat domain, L domain-containing protein [Rosa chinensis]|uniref:Putative F-box domain, leucine-rich repeat domain, L domain-containing protein n=2 Tax=Rosa TaxID=3764 RepID=A0A2P6Q5Y6_ROSCH|nr:F-box protein SKIP19 isoform X1 [Rosa chinensis]PRQ29574.1 putative F-box domain, leucine-rich repeat domain, L domain-containing protein [Rosa chinensis]
MRKSSRRTAHGGRHRNWTELPDDITASILSRLGTLEILRTAQRVCMTWRRICKDNSLVWQSIYIHDEHYIDMSYLDKICRHVIDLSSGNLVDISIEYIGTDQLLKYMAESSSGIKRLRFVNCTSLTDEGFSEVASKLPLLEDLDISKCDNISSKSLQVVTCSFPLLKSCKLNSLKLNISSESRWLCKVDYCHG